MSLSNIIHKQCKICGKTAVEESRFSLGDSTLITLVCGHLLTEDSLNQSTSEYSAVKSSDGRTLMPFQVAGVQFAERANARVLIADEQGLGKTVQALALLKLHPELLPAVVVTKTTLKHQWHHELIRWCGVNGFLCQVINSSKEKASSAFQVFIVTYDLLKTEDMFSQVEISTVIIDECQAIKNHLSGRAKAVQNLAKITPHVIGLSGTPIKNHAGEYFTILNILQPTRFSEHSRFLREYCDSYETMYGWKVGGLSQPEAFRQATDDFIIRRTRTEVLPDLPVIDRKFYHVELDKKLGNAYNQAQAELDELFYADEDSDTMTNMLAVMAKMRKITGISKVTECVDFLSDFLFSCERKITVFVHHHAVHDLLKANIDTWLESGGFATSLSLTSELDGEARSAVITQFKDGPSRILIASTLAAGEGLNLQFCSDAILLERQWNPANEEQAEGRFIRIGQEATKVTMTYMLASETIDEYFSELVETKRAIVSATLDGKIIEWSQSSLIKELAAVLVAKGKKKFSL